jgi:hypothetical protein
MIHYNPNTRTFTLLGRSSHYSLYIDQNGRFLHLSWGPRPPGDERWLDNGRSPRQPTVHSSFDFQSQRDELPTYGDISVHEVALKASFPDLPATLRPGEAPHRPIRDLRLRYTGHEIEENGQSSMVNGQWSTAGRDIPTPNPNSQS